MTWPFGALRMFGYDLLVVDPPWDFENYSDAGTIKGPDPHYRVMPLAQIKALPVGDLAGADALMLLWTCGWAMATGQALDVARAWGFRPITELVWRKTTINGKIRMGTGYRARSMHEPILLCVTGNPRHIAFPSIFDGLAREHSRKPEEFYRLVETCCAGLRGRVDLFSREGRPGWDSWGDQADKFDAESLAAKPRITA